MEDLHATDKEGFIPGIYNYCDRWCEQCRFVDRCRVGFAELDPESGGFKQHTLEDALQEVSANLKHAMEMLQEMAKERGLDMDEVMKEAEEDVRSGKQEREMDKAAKHPASALTMQYAMDCQAWQERNSEALKETIHALAKKASLNIAPEAQVAVAERIHDAMELISRYQFPIATKSNRAICGRAEGPDESESDLGPYQNDFNGSAKLALILMERSMAAWAVVLEIVPSLTDDSLALLALLRKCHQRLELEFPNARLFIRPGFDAPQQLQG